MTLGLFQLLFVHLVCSLDRERMGDLYSKISKLRLPMGLVKILSYFYGSFVCGRIIRDCGGLLSQVVLIARFSEGEAPLYLICEGLW